MDANQLALLKTELTADPAGIGYAPLTVERHVEIARLINRPGRSADRDSLTSGLLVSCLDKTEFTALAPADKAYLNLFVTAGEVTLTQDVRQALRGLFPQGSKTRGNINAAIRRDASRAEELGFGRVTESDIADALRTE